MNKRDQVLSLLDPRRKQEYIPAGFFLHFEKSFHAGRAAVEKHLEFFRYTDMDFVKIQYERTFPFQPQIRRPGDWAKMPLYKRDFFEGQLSAVEGLVKEAGKEALVLVTLYSPFMCAGDATSATAEDRQRLLTQHIRENPQAVRKGMEIITESMMFFARECIKLGVDGFYTSTQGGESGRFGGSLLFDECIRPYDLAVMEEIARSCAFNILHVCDYVGEYDDLTPYLNYPGHVVNCSLKLGTKTITGQDASRMFGRPYMGGMDRKGVIVFGDDAEIRSAVEGVLRQSPEKFILGADCTVPSDINWDNLRVAISAAHEWRK